MQYSKEMHLCVIVWHNVVKMPHNNGLKGQNYTILWWRQTVIIFLLFKYLLFWHCKISINPFLLLWSSFPVICNPKENNNCRVIIVRARLKDLCDLCNFFVCLIFEKMPHQTCIQLVQKNMNNINSMFRVNNIKFLLNIHIT